MDPSAAPADLGPTWIRATFLGWLLGFVLLLLLIGASGAVGLGDTQFPLGLGMGLGVGLMQGRVVRRRLEAGAAWWRATALGVTLPFLVSDLSRKLALGLPYSLPALIVAGGLTAGLLQWRLLRPLGRRAAWWIPAAMLGWALAGAAVSLNDRLMPRIPGLVGALMYVAGVLAGGALLGLAGAPVIGRVLPPPPAPARP